MANTKSAKKEIRKSEKNKYRNKKIKENIKTLTKKSRKAIENKDSKAKDLVFQTMKALDKAGQKGVIKNNTKNRKKSKLHLSLNKTTSI